MKKRFALILSVILPAFLIFFSCASDSETENENNSLVTEYSGIIYTADDIQNLSMEKFSVNPYKGNIDDLISRIIKSNKNLKSYYTEVSDIGYRDDMFEQEIIWEMHYEQPENFEVFQSFRKKDNETLYDQWKTVDNHTYLYFGFWVKNPDDFITFHTKTNKELQINTYLDILEKLNVSDIKTSVTDDKRFVILEFAFDYAQNFYIGLEGDYNSTCTLWINSGTLHILKAFVEIQPDYNEDESLRIENIQIYTEQNSKFNIEAPEEFMEF